LYDKYNLLNPYCLDCEVVDTEIVQGWTVFVSVVIELVVCPKPIFNIPVPLIVTCG
jgi:hypothetical protein